MVRVTHSVATHRRKKRLKKMAKGYWGDRKNHIRTTGDAVTKALAYNYRDRKDNKRQFRRLWITRIGIATKIHGVSYSRFIQGLHKMGCELDRKMLAQMAVTDPQGFADVVGRAKAALA